MGGIPIRPRGREPEIRERASLRDVGMSTLRERLARALAGRAPMQEADPTLIRAAVAVIAAPDPDAILLIRRAERPGDPWSGQMGLPGGRSALEDPDLLHTAARETMEEVGISLAPRDLVGLLDDVAPRTPHLPPLMVRPYVFCLARRPEVVANAEVAAHFWVGLDALLHPASHRPVSIPLAGAEREFPAFHVSPIPVWGLTERILTPLVAGLRST